MYVLSLSICVICLFCDFFLLIYESFLYIKDIVLSYLLEYLVSHLLQILL